MLLQLADLWIVSSSFLMSCNIVVLYYSRDGNTRRMANQIARSITTVEGCCPVLRTVPEISRADTSTPESTDKSRRHLSLKRIYTKQMDS